MFCQCVDKNSTGGLLNEENKFNSILELNNLSLF